MRVDVQGSRNGKKLSGDDWRAYLVGLICPPPLIWIGLKISAKIWWGPVPVPMRMRVDAQGRRNQLKCGWAKSKYEICDWQCIHGFLKLWFIKIWIGSADVHLAHLVHFFPTALMRVDAFYYWKKRASSSLDKILEEQLKIMHTDQDWVIHVWNMFDVCFCLLVWQYRCMLMHFIIDYWCLRFVHAFRTAQDHVAHWSRREKLGWKNSGWQGIRILGSANPRVCPKSIFNSFL